MAISGRFIRCFGIFLLLPVCFSVWAIAADVSLAWDPSSSENIAGYRVYLGNSSKTYNAPITIGNQTTYKVMGLSNGTWYFAVTAFDADGTESDYSNEVSQIISTADTTPPNISGVTSSSISGTRATISWITNEASDTQVEYGLTASYGSSTTLRESMVTSHSQALRDLAVSRTYHYRVRSRDAAGNLAISGDHVFTTTEIGTPPIISNVEASEITDRSALISWDTDVSADSQVEYWVADGAVHKSALGSYVTHHSIRLNNLQKETLYYFKVTAADPDNNQTTSSEYPFTTIVGSNWVTAIPRFTDRQENVNPGDEIAIGVALTNSGVDDADISFSAVDSNGYLIQGLDIVNPGVLQLSPQTQHAILDVEIFGFGLEPYGSKGWIKLESTVSTVDGFFLIFDSKLSLMDGTSLGNAPLTDFIFTEVAPNGSTQIDIINDNDEDTEVVFDLMAADGSVRTSQTRRISRNGALVADLNEDLFSEIAPEAGDYVRMNSTRRVQPFELMQREMGDIASLAGQDISEGGTTLYSPQYVLGSNMHTTLTVINLDSKDGTVVLQFVSELGTQIGDTRTLQIPANGKLFIDDPEFFAQLDPERIASGYVKVVGDGVRIAGSTVFGHSNGKSYTAALPLIHDLQDSVIFSHVASSDILYTGLAIVNPGDTGADAVIQLYAVDGGLMEETSVYIPAGQRKTRVMTEFFPSLIGKEQCNGHIRIISSKPLATFALFGTTNMSVLSAIPPKTIR